MLLTPEAVEIIRDQAELRRRERALYELQLAILRLQLASAERAAGAPDPDRCRG